MNDTKTALKPIKLSRRQAEVVAAFLNDKGSGTISIARCHKQTPTQIASAYLGASAPTLQLRKLEAEILERLDLA